MWSFMLAGNPIDIPSVADVPSPWSFDKDQIGAVTPQ
jgi:hypothetical protein